MTSVTLGDLALNFMLQKRGVALRQDMARVSEELATGRVSDVNTVTAGNFDFLNSIERDLGSLDGYRVVGVEAKQLADATQLELERVQNTAASLGSSLLSFANLPAGPQLLQGATEARGALDTIFAALNSDIAGRSIFSGVATDSDALASTTDLLSALESEIAGLTSVADIRTAAEAWFSSPTGFDQIIYNGSTSDLAPFRLNETEDVSVGIRADNDAIKNIILDTALAALSDSSTLGYPTSLQAEIQNDVGANIIATQQEIIGLRGTVGSAEERIETLVARNLAEKTTLEFARTEYLEVDPFEAATRLEDLQFRLQSLYTITARMSDLSLVNFVR